MGTPPDAIPVNSTTASTEGSPNSFAFGARVRVEPKGYLKELVQFLLVGAWSAARVESSFIKKAPFCGVSGLNASGISYTCKMPET